MKKSKKTTTVKLSDIISVIDERISNFRRILKEHVEYDRYTQIAGFRALIDGAEIVKSDIMRQYR